MGSPLPWAFCYFSVPCTSVSQVRRSPAAVYPSSYRLHHRRSAHKNSLNVRHPCSHKICFEKCKMFMKDQLQYKPNACNLARTAELFEDLLKLGPVLTIKVEFSEFGIRFEPKPVVACLHQRIKCRLVECLQKVNLRMIWSPLIICSLHRLSA